MAAFTSKATGNWSASGQTTWNEVGVPGTSDTVTLAHVITVDVDTTVGNNGGSTAGITMNANSGLTIAAGKKLTCSGRCNLSSNGRIITINAGSTFTFTNTAGVAGIITGNTGCQLVMNGTAGNRAVLSYTGSGGQAALATIPVIASYATFISIKNSGTGSTFASQSGTNVNVDHCLFQSCEYIELKADATSDCTFTNNSFTTSVAATVCKPNFTTATTGVRTITGNCFDGSIVPQVTCNMTNVTFNGNLIEGQFFTSTAAGGTMTSCDGNLIAVDTTSTSSKAVGGLATPGTYSNNYLLGLKAGDNNQHFWVVNALTVNTTMTFDGNIYEYGLTGTTGDLGDCVLADQGSNGTAVVHLYAKNEYVLPSAGGVSSGQGINNAKKARNVTVGAEHCTYFVRSGQLPLSSIPTNSQYARGGGCAERGAPDAFLGSGLIEYFRNNICWADTANAGYKIVFSPDTATGGVESGASTLIAATVLTDTTKTWGTNIFTAGTGAGTYKVRITSGAASGTIGVVSSNTGTTITVASWSAGQPATGDTYVVFVVDVAVEATTINNCGYNVAAGELYDVNNALVGSLQGNGYHQANTTSGNALGTNDITANPGFIDSTRNNRTWNTSLGGAGTNAATLAGLRKKNDDAGYDANYTIAALIAYVKAGFKPTNAALIAANDNVSPSLGWIGAQQGQAPRRGTLTGVGP